ncbi:putative transposase protein [Roseibium aggregatum IAM 12614]|uniref:Putative transposase protein n=1 Tax=Roseibium aggregatum (strain ATCC 25650 / DSM 13394 / JCM 20685 / NBRC 16684 / NCIMB 2208 / IAM 12614 / B1) TaxID=384765 RepID=A0NSF6_ROSAI|nr:putative transposase protein [Roseibium aggregatum IAM 12614]
MRLLIFAIEYTNYNHNQTAKYFSDFYFNEFFLKKPDWQAAGRRLRLVRPYQGLPELDYPFHDRDTLVTACGRICMHRKKINVSTVLAGQKLGIMEVEDGIWLISFMSYDLGYIDLEQRTLQTIDNPFGTRL